jgi:hypothetical protein
MANKKAGFEPLSRYNGYEIYGTANSFFETSYFWNREVADDSNQFNITIGLNIPSTTGNELCKIDLIGNAGHNVHYTLAADWNASFNSDQIVSWGIGEQYKTFRVVLIEQPSWFVQRDLIMKISRASTLVPVDSDDPNKKRYITKNLDIDADHDEAKLTIYSSKKPPVICVSGSDATVTTAGDQVTFNLSSDQVLADPVSLYYKLSGDLSGSVSGHALGTVTIPAGQSEGSVTFEYT